MPSPAPSASNDYLISFDTALDPATLNAVFGSIANRIAAQEATIADYEAAIDQLTASGLAMIAENVGPQLLAAQNTLADLQALAAQLDDDIAAIRAGGIDAPNVVLSAIEGFAPTNVQAAIEALLAQMAGFGTAAAKNVGTASGEVPLLGAGGLLPASVLPALLNLAAADMAVLAGRTYRITAAGITLTLPAAPTAGDTIHFIDGEVLGDGAVATIARNGNTIMGLAEDLTIDVSGIAFSLWWSGTDWRLF